MNQSPTNLKKKSLLGSTGCGFLFLLPFAGVGLFMGYLYVSLLWEAHSAKSWVETPAWIEDSKLHSSTNKGSTTYRTTARYQYEYEGISYTGTRVGYTDSNDNIGGFHQAVYAELQRHQTQKIPFRCFVNPASPDESILYREVRLSLLLFYSVFVIAFGGVGVGGLSLLYRVVSTTRRHQRLRTQFPGEPWRWGTSSADGVYLPQRNLLPLIAVVVWNVFAWTPLFVAFEQIKTDLWSKLYLIAPLAGAVGLWVCLVPIRQRLRFGNVGLRIAPFPYHVSDRLKGTLEFPAALPSTQELEVTLTVKRQIQGQHPAAELFSETKPIVDSAMAWTFEFELPEDLPPSGDTDDDGDVKVIWRIRIRGGGFRGDYEIDALADSSRR